MNVFRCCTCLFLLVASGQLAAQELSHDWALAQARYLLEAGDRLRAQSMADAFIAQADAGARGADDDLATALDIAALARVARRGSSFDKTDVKALAQRSVAIREQLFGADAVELAASLDVRARVAIATGDKDAARRDVERALQLRRGWLGDGDTRLVPGFLTACSVYYGLADYAPAQELCERAVALAQLQTPVDEAQLARAHWQLGTCASANGQPALAIAQTLQSQRLVERVYGKQAVPYVEIAINLGVMFGDVGDYDAALSSYQTAVERSEVLRDNNAALYGGLFNNYGHLLAQIGDYPRAREMLQRALAATADPLTTGTRLTNLADVQRAEGELAAAETAYRRAVELYVRQLGADNARLVFPLSHLGMLLLEKRDYAAAREVLDHALAIGEKAHGPEHQLLVQSLRTLGELDLAEGRYAEARDILQRALRIREREFGEDHPEVAQLRALLAEAIRGSGDDDAQALALALSAEKAGQSHVQLTIRALPEREALTYAAVRPSGLATALGIVATHPDANHSTAVWEAAIGARGLVLNALLQRHRASAEARSPELKRLRQQWIDASSAYARLLIRANSGAAERTQLANARTTMEAADRALARARHADHGSTSAASATLQQIAAALPADSALVAYVRASSRGAAGPAAADHYVAFVLSAPRAQPTTVSLDRVAAIDALVDAWRAATSRAPAPSTSEQASLAAGDALRAAIWDPVARHVASAQRIFIVPDGELLFVNFAALPRDGHYLVESGPTFQLLNDERELLAPNNARRSGELLAIGGADFGVAASGDMVAQADAATARSAGEDDPGCTDSGFATFARLPGSLLEAQDIAEQWGRVRAQPSAVTTLTGAAASAAAFKANASRKTVLHLATHAFADASRCTTRNAGARGVTLNADTRQTASNALHFAGLAFSGANRAGDVGNANDDGIVTAEEIGTLDLHQTAWAVLSACNTGVGRVLAGEGVLGLRYAFRAAGVRTVIMSLWDADDDATREWMHELYVARLQRNASTTDAVRAASINTLRRRRAAGLSTHPYYWAPFVAVGDWR